MMDRANSFVGGSNTDESQAKDEAIAIVDPFSTGFNLAAEICKAGYKCVRVFSIWDSPIAALVNNEFSIDFSVTIQHNDRLTDQSTAIEETATSLLGLPFPLIAVIPGAETGVELADQLSHRLGLRSNGIDEFLARRNKYLMGEKVRSAGLRAVKQATCTTLTQMNEFLDNLEKTRDKSKPFKCVVKPVQSAGTDDVFLCNSRSEAEKYFKRILGKINGLGLLNSCVLVQEFLVGREYVVDQVSRDGVHKVVAIWEYDKRPNNKAAFVYYGMDIKRSDTDMAQSMVQYANKVLDALHILHGPSHMEIMLNTYNDPQTGEIIYDPCLVEVGARCHGGEGSWLPIVNECIGYSQVNITVDVYLTGKLLDSIPTNAYKLLKHGCEVDIVSKASGILRSTPGEQHFLSLKSYRNHHWEVKPGDFVAETIDCYTIPCWIILVADTEEEMWRDNRSIHHYPGFLDYAIMCPNPPPMGAIVIVDPFSTGIHLAAMVLQWGYKLILVFSKLDEKQQQQQQFVSQFMLQSGKHGHHSNHYLQSKNKLIMIQHDHTHPDENYSLQQTLDRIIEADSHVLAIIPGTETGITLADSLSYRYGTRGNGEELASIRNNKAAIHDLLEKNHVPCIHQRLCTNVDEAVEFYHKCSNNNSNKDDNSPNNQNKVCVIKPNESAGNDQIFVCHNDQEVRNAFHTIHGHINGLGNYNQGALIQEYILGIEYAIDGVLRDGTFKITAIWEYEKRTVNGKTFVPFGMNLIDAGHDAVILLRNYANDVLKCLKIENGAVHLKVIINSYTNQPLLVEITNCCHGGEGTWLSIVNECIGYSQVEATLSCYVRPDRYDSLSLVPVLLNAGCEMFLISYHEGQLKDIPGINQVRGLSSFRRLDLLAQPGSYITKTVDSFTCPGSLQLVNRSSEILQQDARMTDVRFEKLKSSTMFSPMGNKKILLRRKFGGSKIEEVPKARSVSPGQEELMLRARNKEIGAHTDTTALIASKASLEKALSDVGVIGVIMNRILHSTSRYRPERDAHVLKTFQSKSIPYDKFRQYLYSIFWLTFTDDEFEGVTTYFDPHEIKTINGYDFMIAFIKLNSIRKDRESLLTREKQESFVQSVKLEEEQKKYLDDKKHDIAVDYNFTEEIKKEALRKLSIAASKFDPNHPASPSVESFHVKSMKPYIFREMLKLTFNLRLDPVELGAVIKAFDDKVEDQNIPASEFLKFFLRLGHEQRDMEKTKQRIKQEKLNEKAEKEKKQKLEEESSKLILIVDYNFTHADEVSITEKLRKASTKYNKSAPGSVGLNAFECESLMPIDFKDIIRQVFNVVVTATEMGYLVKKYDKKQNGSIYCKSFLTDFFRLGQEERHKMHSEQIKKQQDMNTKAQEEHEKKMKDVLENGETLKIDSNYTDDDLQSALHKLTEASLKYDKERGVSLISFDPLELTPLDFKKALKRTFNIRMTPKEMGAIVNYYDRGGTGKVHCQKFLTSFVALGFTERSKIHSNQLQLQREAELKAKEEHQNKVLDLDSKVLYDVDFNFTKADRDSAIHKMTIAATKYDPNHPAALGLDGFERLSMKGGEFKEIVRRTFNLKLNSKEVGALFKFFKNTFSTGEEEEDEADKEEIDSINSGEFIKYFLRLGNTERAKVHIEQIEKQRRENHEREIEHQQKVMELITRSGSYVVDTEYKEEDKKSIMDKLLHVSEMFDKNHPAAPSLEAFEVHLMPPGLFRENLKSVFGIRATPKEIGYLLELFDKDKTGQVNIREFMLKFLAMGKEARFMKRKEYFEKKRRIESARKKEEEDKINAQYEKAELKVDYEYTLDDFKSAIEKMTQSSFKYDKNHPAAPSLDGFSGGPMKPGAFREIMRRTFNVWFTPKELGAVVHKYCCENNTELVDGKQFLIAFMKLGFEKRSRLKIQSLEKQRKAQLERDQEHEMKLRLLASKVELDIDPEYTETDRTTAMNKLIKSAALYDKNAPGCVALTAFDAIYLTPSMFREVVKRTFNIIFTPKELTAMIAEFNDGKGNISCQQFVVTFIKLGAEEREKVKTLQLAKQRQENHLRKTEHERKMKEADDKVLLKLDFRYTEPDKESAFEKLSIAAKKYDKSHPASMSLDGFEEKELKPHTFREMIKRTFGVILSNPELGAVMHYFDKKGSGTVPSQKFLIWFLKLGNSQRNQEKSQTLIRLRKDAELRSKEEEEKLAGQWAKMELKVSNSYTEEEKKSALEKMTEAAFKFDPASPGPMGLTAFQAESLTPAVFREMLRRSFNMKLSDGELAALVAEFDRNGDKKICCREFMVKFTQLGFDKRSEVRRAQLEKQRKMNEEALLEAIKKQKEADDRAEIFAEQYNNEDAESALEKIRVIASNYDRSHASAPSLQGFVGTDMTLKEFKFMMMRTFQVPLSTRELTALMHFFHDNTATEGEKPERINTRNFLTYFNKIQRDEANLRRKNRIHQERELIRLEQEEKARKVKEQQDLFKKQLEYTEQDELDCVANILHAAEEYTIDNTIYIEKMQGYKGPALAPDKFKELFYRIFNIKLSFPQVGVLLSILDHEKLGSFDGPRFLNWFYKLSRLQEKIFLEGGEANDVITLETLKSLSVNPVLVKESPNKGTPVIPKHIKTTKTQGSETINNDSSLEATMTNEIGRAHV